VALDPTVRRDLAALVRAKGYEYREQPFTLTSGGTSHDYVDGKHAVAAGADLGRVARAAVESVEVSWDVVGGPTMGADALAHAISLLTGAGWFSIRKEPKGHGRGAWIEGSRLEEGQRALVVEDVVSTGGSLLKGVDRLRQLGVEVVAATALLDRSPLVAARLAAAGIAWAPLLTWDDLGIAPL
jgi:orotate phosphoribosyltransferase